MFWHSMAGEARQGETWHGKVRHGWRGMARLVAVLRGCARYVLVSLGW